jgi:hypothetical protein
MNDIELAAGKDLDMLVAEKVMGWTDWRGDRVKPPGEDSREFKPSIDIAAAWLVAEKVDLFKNCRHLHENGVGIQKGDTWSRTGWEWVVEEVFQPVGLNEILARGETAALAICRAALLVAEEDKRAEEANAESNNP